jgi:hypothetical protein
MISRLFVSNFTSLSRHIIVFDQSVIISVESICERTEFGVFYSVRPGKRLARPAIGARFQIIQIGDGCFADGRQKFVWICALNVQMRPIKKLAMTYMCPIVDDQIADPSGQRPVRR